MAGVRTPSPISHLKDQMPEVYDQFVEIATRLENYFRDMQDMEFTIEDGHLYMLQTRNGKRTAQAALQIACDLVDEGMITEQEAVLRVEPKQLDTLLHPQFDAAALKAAEVDVYKRQVSQCMVAGPMVLLYFISIFLSGIFYKPKEDDDDEEDDEDEDEE